MHTTGINHSTNKDIALINVLGRSVLEFGIRFALACLILSFFSSYLSANEYESESAFSKSYKCTTSFGGGFLHQNGKSQLEAFPDGFSMDFFLTHITDLPLKALNGFASIAELENEAAARREFEEMKNILIRAYDGGRYEERTYYIRPQAQDPNDPFWLVVNECSVSRTDDFKRGSETVSCTIEPRSRFSMDLTTNKFSIAALGGWHLDSGAEAEASFSSVSFGHCSEYYF